MLVLVYYHPVQLFNTRVSGYGLLPSHPTFQNQGLVWSTTIPSNFSTPGSGMVYYHSIQLFNTRVWYGLLPSRPTFQHQGLVWSTTIPSNFSTSGSGMVYYHSIQFSTPGSAGMVYYHSIQLLTPGSGMVYYHPVQLFNTRVWYGLLPFHPAFQHQGQWMKFLETNILEVRGKKGRTLLFHSPGPASLASPHPFCPCGE